MKKMYILIMIILSALVLAFVYNDHFLYKTPIMSVTSVKNTLEEETTTDEPSYIQHITGVIKNGKYKGKKFKTTNTYLSSLVYDDKIENHTEIFVEISNNGNMIMSIKGIKRDKYLAILLVIFIDLIILIAGKKGLKTLGSLLLNIGITVGATILFMNNMQSINLLLLFMGVSLLFIIGSLFVTNGKSKKTLAAIVSSIVSLLISFGLSFLLIKLMEDKLYIWNIDYIEAMHDYTNFVYVCVLLCGLGAIMDISITIASALSELIRKDPSITKKALIKSGKEITKDIIGTMINVMLFTCYTSVIPTIILAVRNNVQFINAIDFYGNMELMIVLCNCIGIVLTIPISLFISILILSKRKDVK